MEYLEVVALAFIQGLTEFLPISSSGHLVVARLLFGFSDVGGNSFDAFLHLGTLLAVLVYYRSVWVALARSVMVNDEEGRDKRELAAKLALATVPAAVAGYVLQDDVSGWLRTPQVVAVGLLATAIALAMVELARHRMTTIRRASFFDAVLIGLAQVGALIPGVSRSGITIAAGRARGLSRRQAATFSFLLSAPIIAGAGLASISSLGVGQHSSQQLLLGLLVSFVAGIVAIHLLLKLVERVALWPFAAYLVVMAAVVWYVS